MVLQEEKMIFKWIYLACVLLTATMTYATTPAASEEVLWVDGDPDDIKAFITIAREFSDAQVRLVGISTNLFYPKPKAQIAKFIFASLGLPK